MEFATQLLEWYEKNKRNLPWRNSASPYRVWLSEIILQQTRVDQGMSYYLKFVEHYPTVEALANAPEDEVMKLWQGLGYYSRARNLHYTAKHVANELNGQFPNHYKGLLQLKGVGKYTAAAIASFCFQERVPVIDGNVYRVLARVYGITDPIDTTSGTKTFETLANELISPHHPDTYNQAIMEFGALHCTPKQPGCDRCIFQHSCVARSKNMVGELPKKSKRLKQRNRYFNYLVLNHNNNIYINKRTGKDIWQNLYDFPLVETSKAITAMQLLEDEAFKTLLLPPFKIARVVAPPKHVLSHQKIHAKFWEINLEASPQSLQQYTRIKQHEIGKYPVPKLVENYLNTP